MPPRPRSPKSRTGATRRPRVAGLTPATQRPESRPDPRSAGAERRDARRPADRATPAAFPEDPLAEPLEPLEPAQGPSRPAPATGERDEDRSREPAVPDPDALDEQDGPRDQDGPAEPPVPAAPAGPGRRADLDDAPTGPSARSAPAEPDAPAAAPKTAQPLETLAATAQAPVRPTPTRRPVPTPDPAAAATFDPPTESIPVVDLTATDTAVLDLRALRAEPAAPLTEADPQAAPEAETLTRVDTGAPGVAGTESESKAGDRRKRAWRGRFPGWSGAVPILALAFVVLIAAAVTFGVLDARVRNTPAATNTALVDVAGTAEAAGQLSDALETVYSFDYTRLDENERAARDVITPEFAAEFDNLFAEVRRRAPEQQAVVSATVTLSAVKELTGNHAVLVAFVDQQATRASPDADSRQLAAAGRLTVTGEKVDGRWKIASVVPR